MTSKKTTKLCRICQTEKHIDEFSTCRRNKDGKQSRCRACEHDHYVARSRKVSNDVTVSEKECSVCGETKSASEFNKRRYSTDGLQPLCRVCYHEYLDEWSLKNPDYHTDWYVKNREYKLQWRKDYIKNNPEKMQKARVRWRLANPEKYKEFSRRGSKRARLNGRAALYDAKRRAAYLQAIPKWYELEQEAILSIYAECKQINLTSDVKHAVDHIVPLQSPLVCGLHTLANLRIITFSENSAKLNRHWPDMP